VFIPACKYVIRCISATRSYNSLVQSGSQGWVGVDGVLAAQGSVVESPQVEPDGRESGSLASDDSTEQEIASRVVTAVQAAGAAVASSVAVPKPTLPIVFSAMSCAGAAPAPGWCGVGRGP
jgi:hypothetical protein